MNEIALGRFDSAVFMKMKDVCKLNHLERRSQKSFKGDLFTLSSLPSLMQIPIPLAPRTHRL